jgi:hypothetical protein
MEVKGKIIAVQPVQSGEGRNGAWKKQDYVIEYEQDTQYPRKLMFNLWGEKIDQYNIQLEQILRVSFDIDCREYNGRWYNDIRAWRVETGTDDAMPPDTGGNSAPSTPFSASPFTPPAGGEGASDTTSDLPF